MKRVWIHNYWVPAHGYFSNSFHSLVLSFPRGQWSASLKPIGIWDTPCPPPPQLLKEDGSVTPGSLPPLGSSCLPWALVVPSKMGRRSCCGSGPGSRLLGEAPLSYPHLQDEIRLSGQREGWVSHREIQSILCDPHTPTLTPLAHPSAKPVVTLCSAVV